MDQLAPHSTATPEVNFKDYLTVILRRRMLFARVFILVVAVGVVVTLLQKPVYETHAKLAVPLTNTKIDINDVSNPLAAVLQSVAPDSVETQLEILQSTPFMEEARRLARVTSRPGKMEPEVRVEATTGKNVILITAEGGEPKEIARLVNAMLELHRNQTNRLQTNGLEGTIAQVKREKEKAAKNLAKAAQALIQFNKEHRVVKLATQRDAKAREYIDLQAKVRETKSNVTNTRAQITELRSMLQKEPLYLVEADYRVNPRIEKYQNKLDDYRLEREDLLRQYRENHKRVQAVDRQIATLEQRLKNEPDELKVLIHKRNQERAPLQIQLAQLRASLQGMEAAHNSAQAQFDARAGDVDNMEGWEVQQALLTHERDTAQAAYTALSEQLRNLLIRQTANVQGIRIIERAAVPTEPIRPRKAVNLAFTAVLALFLAAGLVFLQEYLDDRVNSADDIERVSALPTLGYVPLMPAENAPLVSALAENSQMVESYRALRSTIGFAGVDAPIRRLLVTSASRGEGKSTTSANLAVAMAMDGKRVILVDADMRRPSVHRVFNLPNVPGLSEILVGMKTIAEALQETDVANLSVLCAGPIPPNPAELLGSRAFDQLIETLEACADVVIFDSPPCLPVTDPLIIATRMHGVVLVLHAGQTKKAAIKHVEGLLNRARARVIGVVFNRAPQEGPGSYYPGYYLYGDGYYAETAQRGERHRRNGRGSKRELEAGTVAARNALMPEDDRD